METTTTVADIARQIDDAECLAPCDFDTFVRMLDATGPKNAHLRLETEPRRYDRMVPLDSNLPVYGKYVTVSYDSHWPRLTLNEHQDRNAMAEFVVDWTLLGCEVFAFEDGRRLRYRILWDEVYELPREDHQKVSRPTLQWIS